MSETVTLRNKKTGELVTLRRKESSIEKEPAFLPNANEVESKIASRPDSVARLKQELKTPFPDITQHPLSFVMKPSVTALKTVAIPFQRAEAGLAGAGLAAQRGDFSQMGKEALQGLLGKRQAEFGDISRTTGFGGGLNEPISILLGMGGAAGMGNLATGLKAGTMATIKQENIAGHVINSILKPSHKEWLFGKNPGLGVAKEGILARSVDDLAGKIDNRISVLDDASIKIRNVPENINKTVDLTNIRKPLVSAREELKRMPRTNVSEVKSIDDAINDVEDLVTNLDKVGLGRLNISDAYIIKKAVSKAQKWNIEAASEANKALRQVYHFVDDKIDNAIPELKGLNERMANLISAKQAINHRIERLQSTEPVSWKQVLDLPFAVTKWTGTKTMLGKLLSNQVKLPK